jgi:biofilm PGA synthesis N-glycosyltransferase PgaC
MKTGIANRSVVGIRAIASFFVPQNYLIRRPDVQNKLVAAIIPAYKPQMVTYKLVLSLVKWNPKMLIVLVDDCTPLDHPTIKTINKIRKLANSRKRVIYLRTPENKLKSGALNWGILYLTKLSPKPNVVITFDDDVIVTPKTILTMLKALYSEPKLGAVCSQTRVKNRKNNILTRLQALEYHGFTIAKIADNKFLLGPLVMQGMLTAFRMRALEHVRGFTAEHLIEDYDITVRIKKAGYRVGIAKDAVAWTRVPTNFSSLWRQRVRWGYGGLEVLAEHGRHITTVFQDVVGHCVFLTMLMLIFASFLVIKKSATPPVLIFGVLLVALLHLIAATIFNIIALKTDRESDRLDWLLKLTILPELVYSNILAGISVGTYLFYLYNLILGFMADKIIILKKLHNLGLVLFDKLGYSVTWGTRLTATRRSVVNI